ncbi:hypothetical protein A2U01_0101571, partial [Trifolium medium]|nr:hypothetical protein [Trifolium medium]
GVICAARRTALFRAEGLLVPVQCAWVVGATRSRCWGCPVFFWFLGGAQGSAAQRACLLVRVDFC